MTRFWTDTVPSLIDHSWTNIPDIIHCKNVLRPVADHNVIETVIKLKNKPRSKCEIIKRKWKGFDMAGYQEEVKNLDWDSIYEISDANLAYNYLEEKLLNVLDKFAPIVKVQPAGRNKSWITSNTLQHIKTRDQLKKTAHETNYDEEWAAFRSERNKVTGMVKKDKQQHFEK